MLVTQRSAYGCRTPPQILLEEQLGLFSQQRRHLNLKGARKRTSRSRSLCSAIIRSLTQRQATRRRTAATGALKKDLRTGCDGFTNQT